MALRKTVLEVVTYNVLSSHLSKAEELPKCEPAACNPSARLKRLQNKLLPHIQSERVLCLQEISREWYGRLLPMFRRHGYTCIPGLYGYGKNGYMGVMLAYADGKYELESCETSRVSDRAKWWVPREEKGIMQKGWDWIRWGLRLPEEQEGGLSRAKGRHNMLVMGCLRDRETQHRVVVGTYHMPCDFRRPDVMQLHVAAAARQLQEYAGDLPCVLAGDFNFQPDSECYRLVTGGGMSEEEAKTLRILNPTLGKEHTSLLFPMRSAYKEAVGAEPAFTNYSYTEWNGGPSTFIGTLDYIFYSPHFGHVEAEALPASVEVLRTPLPTLEEPSDHLLVSAKLTLEE